LHDQKLSSIRSRTINRARGLGARGFDRAAAAMARRIILDVDTGVDDAVAIVFAVLDPRIELVAVTWCVRVTSRAGTSRRSRAERLAASCGSAY
jgi:hypothetical protein